MDPDLFIVSGTSYIINPFDFPPTPTANEIQIEGTAIAVITLLPKNSGGGLLYSSSSRLAPGDPPVTISRALISMASTEPPVLFFSRITESPVFLQPLSSGIGRLSSPTPIVSGANGLATNIGGTGSQVSGRRAITTASAFASRSANNNDLIPQRNTKLEGGSIAAIVIVAMLVLAFGILAIYKALHYRRTQKKKNASCDGDNAVTKVVEKPWNATVPTNRHHRTSKPEPSTHTHIHELDPTPMTPRELMGDAKLAPYWKPEIMSRPLPNQPRIDIPVVAKRSVTEMSPHAEAQRERELQWLETEEAKIRKRREQLIQQGGRRPSVADDAV